MSPFLLMSLPISYIVIGQKKGAHSYGSYRAP
jgi:hypothetical protein